MKVWITVVALFVLMKPVARPPLHNIQTLPLPLERERERLPPNSDLVFLLLNVSRHIYGWPLSLGMCLSVTCEGEIRPTDVYMN